MVLYTSPLLLAELEEVLARNKFMQRIANAGSSPAHLIDGYLSLVQVVKPLAVEAVVARDPDDDHVLACALAAQADVIVSGDKDLLDLCAYRGIPILTAALAMARVAGAK